MRLSGSIKSVISVTVIGVLAVWAPAQAQGIARSTAASSLGPADAANAISACCSFAQAAQAPKAGGELPACCSGFASATPRGNPVPTASAPAARWKPALPSGVVNDVCPACGLPVGDGRSTVSYNGFDVAVCGPACERDFTAFANRTKDAFISRYVKPVGGGCPLSACCAIGRGSPYITYSGTLFQVCCQGCLNWWERADEKARSRVYNTRILPGIRDTALPADVAFRPVGASAVESVGDDGFVNGIVLRIDGMTCQGCADTVEKALAAVVGVGEVGVLFEQNLAWVGFGAPGAVKEEQLVKAVEDAGFTATPHRNAKIRRVASGGNDAPVNLPACGVPIWTRKVGESAKTPGRAPGQLVLIDETLQPVIDQFNADKNKPRIVALLSPTCGGCIHGAKAILQEAVRAYPDDDLSVLVVWEPMLGPDNLAAARESAAIFDDPRVHQCWDPGRLSGITYSTKVFPNRFEQIAAAMPADHFMKGRFSKAAEVSPERVPMWDFALFYPPGVEWRGDPPRSSNFVRQLAIAMTSDGTTSGTLLVDDFNRPPVESDWFDEVRREMATLMGAERRKPATTAEKRVYAPGGPGGYPDSPTGRAARALVELTHTSGEEALREFVESTLTPGARERNSDATLLEAFGRIRDDLADAELRTARRTGPFSAELVLASQQTGGVVTMTVELEQQPPHRIDRLTAELGGPGPEASAAGPASHVVLGVSTTAPSAAIAAEMQLANRIRTEGRVVTAVEPGSPAGRAGLEPGDVILQLADNRLYSADDVSDFLRVTRPGEKIKMLVKRAGGTVEESLQVTLSWGAQPQVTRSGFDWQSDGNPYSCRVCVWHAW